MWPCLPLLCVLWQAHVPAHGDVASECSNQGQDAPILALSQRSCLPPFPLPRARCSYAFGPLMVSSAGEVSGRLLAGFTARCSVGTLDGWWVSQAAVRHPTRTTR